MNAFVPTEGLSLPAPRILPALDPAFRPAVLAHRQFCRADGAGAIPIRVALERNDGVVSRFEIRVPADRVLAAPARFRLVERWLKFLLWARGGWKIHFAGPPELASALQRHYRESPTGRFDASIMGERIFERPFELVAVAPEQLSPAREHATSLGRHWSGCRIGFDLGASDRKVAAVRDGECVFSEEVRWDPRTQTDPQWHYDQIMDSLRRAAAHLPRVDAIGGSSAGVIVNSQVKVASLFRGVPEPLFRTRVKNLFLELRRAWNVPFEVVNDGEVTALAGSMAMRENAVLGLALGSSLAVGYVTPDGQITSWVNELAFAPVDYRADAPLDEWSGDRGCGAQYLSQQAVGRLLAPAGISLPPEMALPEKLVEVQQLMARGDERAANICRTIGTYLGYTLAHCAAFYDFRHALILGRVMTGAGGELILSGAQTVLREEFPELRLGFHQPDEQSKRHGQAVAAASLPVVGHVGSARGPRAESGGPADSSSL